MKDEQKAIIEITVGDEINFSISNPSGDKNNPAFHIALMMVKLVTEGREEKYE